MQAGKAFQECPVRLMVLHQHALRPEAYLSRLYADTWVKVTAEGEEGMNTILFHGIVTDFAMEQDGYETLLRLKAESGTVLMDAKEHYRVFQNKDTAAVDAFMDPDILQCNIFKRFDLDLIVSHVLLLLL